MSFKRYELRGIPFNIIWEDCSGINHIIEVKGGRSRLAVTKSRETKKMEKTRKDFCTCDEESLHRYGVRQDCGLLIHRLCERPLNRKQLRTSNFVGVMF